MDDDRIIRRKELETMIGLGRSSIYAMISNGQFPAPLRLSKRAVGWRLSQVQRWLSERPLTIRGW